MSAPPARLAVAGLGRIGRLHAENLAARVATAELAAVVDAVDARARSVGELHGVPWFASLDSALDRSEIDGVVVAAPTALHADLVEVAAGAGKHVFCEKPVGFEIEAIRRAVAAVDAAGVHLQVGFQRRFDPDWIALHDALDGCELGALHLLRCSHRNAGDEEEVAEALGDVFVDLAIHDLDAALWLGGEVVELFALTRPGSGGAPAPAAVVSLRFESGALALVDVSRDARYGFECSAELVGSRATARLGYAHRRLAVEVLRDRRAAAPLAAGHAERHDAAYVRELEAFGELVLGRRASVPGGEDAAAALELALLASRSAELGVPLEVAAVRTPLAVASRSR